MLSNSTKDSMKCLYSTLSVTWIWDKEYQTLYIL